MRQPWILPYPGGIQETHARKPKQLKPHVKIAQSGNYKVEVYRPVWGRVLGNIASNPSLTSALSGPFHIK